VYGVGREVKMIKDYKDLDVWKKSIDLVKQVYLVTKDFPKEEIYGLTNQIRRAAVSVASNIAEGKGRYSKKEYTQFLHIALGSVAELETQIIIAKELSYIKNETIEKDLFEKMNHTTRMLRSLIKKLRNN
jgi:four helix bundle protein